MSAGQKILDGLKDAVAGNFNRVTIEGQTWVRVFSETKTLTAEQYEALMAAVKALDRIWPFFAGEHAYDHPDSVVTREARAALRAAGIEIEG